MKKNIVYGLAGLASILAVVVIYSQVQWNKSEPQEVSKIGASSGLESVTAGENPTTGNEKYSFTFLVNEDLYAVAVFENGIGAPAAVASHASPISIEKYFTTSAMSSDILAAMNVPNGMIFYSAVQSNLDNNQWFYTEREDEGLNFNVISFNINTGKKELLFERSGNKAIDYALKPISLSTDGKLLYLEAFIFDSYLNHEAIWVCDLTSLQFKKLNIDPYFTSTPKISPDGRYLLYTASAVPNDVHVSATKVYVYDLLKNEEILIHDAGQSLVGVKGWSIAE